MIGAVWRVSRSTVDARRAHAVAHLVAAVPTKRGPHTPLDDTSLVTEIRAVLGVSPFHTEGHRKVRVRLRARGIHVGKQRVLRLMRTHRLLAPTRRGHPHGNRAHAGTITTTKPNELWGTDATRFFTRQDGWCWVLRGD